MKIIPSIDLRNGSVVRLRQGDYADQINYTVDPVAVVRDFARTGAELIHIVDLDGAKAGRPAQLPLIGELVRAAGVPVQVGGGVRGEEDIRQLFAAGATRVVIGTHAMENWDWFRHAVHQNEWSGRLVLALDARDGIIATRAWTASAGRTAKDVASEVADWPLGGILYTDVARDGMLTGPNIPATLELVQCGRVPVIASGGVGSLDHIRNLLPIGCWGAIVGRSLYEGKVNLAEAIALTRPPEADGKGATAGG